MSMPTTSGGVKADAMDDFSCSAPRKARARRSFPAASNPFLVFLLSLSSSSLLLCALSLSHQECVWSHNQRKSILHRPLRALLSLMAPGSSLEKARAPSVY